MFHYLFSQAVELCRLPGHGVCRGSPPGPLRLALPILRYLGQLSGPLQAGRMKAGARGIELAQLLVEHLLEIGDSCRQLL